MVDMEAQRKLSRALEGGEKLIWTGAPQRGLRLLPSDFVMIPLSLLWAGFALVSFARLIIRNPTLGAVLLFGVPVTLFSIYIFVGRFVWDAICRANTVYGLTEQRAIIRFGVFSKSFDSIFWHRLTDMSLTEKSDGSGTILFASNSAYNRFFARAQWLGMQGVSRPGFDSIPNVREVYDQILRARRAATDRKG